MHTQILPRPASAPSDALDTHSSVPRIHALHPSQAVHGIVQWSPAKSLWWFAMVGITLGLGWQALSWGSFMAFVITTSLTLCLGHSLGMHRRFIHNSYQCPLWLEYIFVWLGTLVGMAGPLGMMRTHDTRDWAQRQPQCHDYFAHRQSFLRDGWWQIHCELKLDQSPEFQPEQRVEQSHFYAFIESTWMAQQMLPAALLYALGGWDFVIWGVCARVTVCVTGHWLIGHFAHREHGNPDSQHWQVTDASVQGHNVHLNGVLKPITAWLTFGECWHNNHHAHPGSAQLGLHARELDPGWYVLRGLHRLGLVWNIKTSANLPHRPTLQTLIK